MLKREDMLELTRRMTPDRNCFSRIAGSYMDGDGYIDGTFNTSFLKLSAKEKNVNLAIAKTVPFSPTNVNTKEYEFKDRDKRAGGIWQMLMGLKECGLKNDAMMEVLYELIGENYKTDSDYAIYVVFGRYDVPLKGTDNASLWESEEVYEFIICTICPLEGEYEPGKPKWGFLFPSFKHRSCDLDHIAVFDADDKNPHVEMIRDFLKL